MYTKAQKIFAATLETIKADGFYKDERVIESPQGAVIEVRGRSVLNFCANNYLGLANNPELIKSAHDALDRWGLGLASVRFICGTQTVHKELERQIAEFLRTEDTILYASCFDANGGLFETLLGEEDAIISAALNHASIIDGIRLCKAQRYRYAHNDMSELETRLREAKNARLRLITTDGVFSMDGDIAKLDEICTLAEKYDAMVHVDECHATGFVGPSGRGSVEYRNVMGRVDVITSTLGKALGGTLGGFTTGRREIVELLRQRSRPYLFSNTLPPAVVAAGIAALQMISRSTDLRDRLESNTKFFRKEIGLAGFTVKSGVHPICPIMLGEAKLAATMARELLDEGIYVIGFSFPVVPKGEARIRVQVSAAHTQEQLTQAVQAFRTVGKRLGVCA